MDYIPKTGEVVALQWRHNLGKGARPLPVDPGAGDVCERRDLALAAAAAVNLRFGAVDVVEVDGEALVLEINSGIMLENAAVSHSEGRALADRVYGRVLDLVYEDERELFYGLHVVLKVNEAIPLNP